MNARSRALRTAALALALALAGAAPARAADVDPATVSAARALAEEGLDLFDKGQYAAALDRFERAEALFKAPTLGLHAARCLEQLGQLVEASERYLQVSRMPLDASASDAFKAAVADAARAYEELRPRVPRLAVAVRGAPEREVQVSIDQKPVPAALVGVLRPINPGAHVVDGAWAGRGVRREVTLSERQEATVVLDFPAPRPGPGGPGPGPGRGPDAGPAPALLHRTLGWAAVGTGAAGLVLGGITFGVTSGLRSDLIDLGCNEDVECPDTPEARDKLGSYNAVRLVPAPAFIVGGALVAGGVALLLTAPSAPAPRGAALRPWITPWGAGIAGVF
ncbi:tetratricopeptide repeat protein [Sorangium sp. So ce131]|uniref:tetratricopeptide repeat protein n=1 Tax=Sorangium sp. So ce131 TaxID=3133282 RepID=UPI003F640A3F